MAGVEDRVYELAKGVALGLGYELVGVELLGRGRRTLLRITIDKEGGITVDDCERLSREVEALLDVEDPVKSTYTLEVSSPGLDRPLKGIEDFRKNVGKLIRLATKEKVLNMNFFIGRLTEVGEDLITLRLDGGRTAEIALSNISKARLEVEIK